MQPPHPGSGRGRRRVELPKGPVAPNKLRVDKDTKPLKPVKPVVNDDKIYRTMPITEKQLGQIKKMYGIK
jgi:hypothetical protein